MNYLLHHFLLKSARRFPSKEALVCEDQRLSYEEVAPAKITLIRRVQQEAYGFEFSVLKEGQEVSKSSSLYKLSPYMGKDNLLRVTGRLQASQLSFEEKHPVIIPKGYLAKLIVRFQHVLMKHAGVETMLTALRNCYWIIGARCLAKQVKRGCFDCKRLDASACNQPGAPLPGQRVPGRA